MSDRVLHCEGLVKRYDRLVAVDRLDLEVRRGECFGLLGPNGAGKTTTVEILEGLLEQDEGSVEVLGRPWRGNETYLRERLGIQLQETRFVEKLTTLETLRLFRSFYSDGVDPVELLARLALTDKADSWTVKLSGGQLQRLSLACALVCRPEILFLDEPTTGLDPQSRRGIWDVLQDCRESGVTVLLTTHYMEEAQRLCDRIAIIDHGKVIALGTPAELIAGLGAEHVIEFAAESEFDGATLERLEGVCGVHRDRDGFRLSVQEVHRAVPALLAELREQRVELQRLTTQHATLEDVFLNMTGRHLRDD